MANQELLDILTSGVEKWNEWKLQHPAEYVDFRSVDLSNVNLRNADFRSVNLGGATLRAAKLWRATLWAANLSGADLSGADLSDLNLNHANLSNTYLSGANLNWTSLELTNLSEAAFDGTTFANVDLSTAKGLDSARHLGPSSIGIDTLYRSGGNIPEVFLRGCGVPDSFITYSRSLIGTAIDFYSCFISYSSKNQDFADRLHSDLQSKGVRCWFAPEDLKIGDKFRQRIDESIRLHDKLLLILSEESIASSWVEDEVEAALERERREDGLVLFPVTIDGAIWDAEKAWAASLRRMRHIGDFRQWKSHDSYQKAFERLLRDLKSSEQA